MRTEIPPPLTTSKYAPLKSARPECYTAIPTTSIQWLWPSRIPRGKITLIIGDPGVGKSLFTLDLAARLSRATPFPDVSPSNRPDAPISEISNPEIPNSPIGPMARSPDGPIKNHQINNSLNHQIPSSIDNPLSPFPVQRSALATLLLSAEDDPSDTIRPRLDAAGADLAHIHHLRGITTLAPTDDPTDSPVAQLEDAINSIPNLALIIIDPITSFLGYTDRLINRHQTVLSVLADLAARHNVAIVMTARLNKSVHDPSQPIYRAAGSLAFASAARAIHLIVPAPPSAPASVNCTLESDGTQCVFIMPPDFDAPSTNFFLLPVKSSLAKKPRALPFQIADSKIQWLPSNPLIPSTDADLHEAALWLYSALAAGPVASNTIHGKAKQNGITKHHLHRALRYLHAECTKEGFQGMWFWRLCGDTRPPSDSTDRFLLHHASLLDDLDAYSATNTPASTKSERAPPVPA